MRGHLLGACKQLCFFNKLIISLALVLFLSKAAPAGPNPHYGPILCTACHVDEEEYELRHEDPTALCNRCHESDRRIRDHHPLRETGAAMTIPEDWPLHNGRLTCLTCHVPSHDENIGMIFFLRDDGRPGDENFCFNCHVRDSMAERNPHAESNRDAGCEFCHAKKPQVGVDTLETVTFCANPDVLCRRCHNTPSHPAGFQHNGELPPDIASKLSRSQKLYRGNRIICSTCHNPHVKESPSLKLRHTIGVSDCPVCHAY